jgi:hypothetical protein
MAGVLLVGAGLLLIVASGLSAIGARVAIAILPQRRWRTRLIVGVTFLAWLYFGVLRKDALNFWNFWTHGASVRTGIVLVWAVFATIPAGMAWLVCRRYDRRVRGLDPSVARLFD